MSYVDQAILQINTALVFIEAPTRRRFIPWHADEDAVLRQWWSRIPRPELSERVSEITRRISGNPDAQRTPDACANRAYELALPVYNGDPGEMSLTVATQLAEVPYHIATRALYDGEFVAIRKGKQTYVSEREWAIWVLRYYERLEMQAEILNALDDETLLTKQEAMKRAGLCETHITRYLQTGIITAWALPGIKKGRPGEWLVSKRSVDEFIKIRTEGGLKAILNGNTAYVKVRHEMSGEIRTLRRNGRLKERDPLTDPRSLYHPGCFNINQVASHVGVSCQVIYEAIEQGHIKAETLIAGGRPRYAIAPDEARRYARVVLAQPEAAKRRDTVYLSRISEAGLLTVRDLARRWKRGEATVLRWTEHLPQQKWGRYVVFTPEVIEAFEKERGMGFLTMRDLARRWKMAESSVAYVTRKAGLPRHRWGRGWVFDPQDVEAYERRK